MEQSFFKIALASCILLVLLSGCTVLGFRIGESNNQTINGVKQNASIFKSIDKGETFKEKIKINEKRVLPTNIDIIDLQFDPQDSLTIYMLARRKGLWVSYNGAETWERLIMNPINAFALSPKKRGLIYTAQKEKIFRSNDGGSEWTEIFSESSKNLITALAVSPSSQNTVYAATKNGIIYESNDQGGSWTVLKKLKARTLNGLFINPKNSHELYITTGLEGVFKSLDNGRNWGILHGLKEFKGSEALLQFKLNSQNPLHLFVASSRGLLASKDGGGKWELLPLLSGNSSTKITAIGFNPFNEKELYYADGYALYKTIDYGASWSILDLSANRQIVKILVDDFDPNIIYIGTGNE